jgi:hypothetical protein
MDRILITGLLFAASVLLSSNVSSAPAQAPDGTVKITSRMVAPGIGLPWGEGVLIYESRDHPFAFKVTGLFRDVDPADYRAGVVRSSVQLKNPADFRRQLPEN